MIKVSFIQIAIGVIFNVALLTYEVIFKFCLIKRLPTASNGDIVFAKSTDKSMNMSQFKFNHLKGEVSFWSNILDIDYFEKLLEYLCTSITIG